ncbi:hypothetical protein AcV5_000214 [Taiwanofungus camphoratus]|nr:hypothetical protein AcV5_000214 [Antrodia cinnamomea]
MTLSTVIGLLQYPNIANDPVARAVGLMSLISTMICLLFNKTYFLYMSGRGSEECGKRWRQNAVDATAFLTNRGPDLLAAPAAWLAWAILLLLALILRSAWALPHNPYGSHSNALSTTGQLSQNESRVGAVAVTLVLTTGLAHYVVVIAAFAKFLSCETNAEFEIHGQTAATTTDEEMELGRTGRDVQEVTLNPL